MKLISLIFMIFSLLIVANCKSEEENLSFDEFMHKDEKKAENNESNQLKRIGIIGSGAGGSSAVHFLHKFSTEDTTFKVDLTLFEKENRIGGRNRHRSFGGLDSQVEIGGSVYHIQNYNIRNWTLASNFTEIKMSEEGTIGVWNGSEFVFWESEWYLVSIAKVLWRYGLSPIRIKELATKVKDQFLNIYHLINREDEGGKKAFFNSPKELFEALGLEDLHRISLEDYLKKEESKVSRVFLDELGTVVTKINYGQNTSISALSGFICFIGSGSEVVSVSEGIASVWEKVLANTTAKVRLNTAVYEIDKKDGKYSLKFKEGDEEKEEIFDSVVIATPLEFSKIKFGKGIELAKETQWKRPYQKTFVTLTTGEIDPRFFGLPPGSTLPNIIGSVDQKDIPWRSISIKATQGNVTAYKIFSEIEMDESLLSKIFLFRESTHHYVWDAYPVLLPTDNEAPPFSIDGEGLYYVNGMESYISVIEGESLAGQNIAQMIYNRSK
eukprot:TRINITY_DN6796_c0_g1_i1.p1 TRINITY_DN6796_c0_g1~~TRINITY_DN6796_c0_g1_i1.p1  ORF type:complete len:533 (-),score=189.86 TRINITY_DN6796_c0_g1_i1:54-1541(-)